MSDCTSCLCGEFQEAVQLLQLTLQLFISPSSRKMRHLNLISYFSPLFSKAAEVGGALNMPHPDKNFLFYAPPLEIPWSNVAVHILHRKVRGYSCPVEICIMSSYASTCKYINFTVFLFPGSQQSGFVRHEWEVCCSGKS